MPIHEYRCERGHTFEAMQRMTDDPLTSCSTCDAPVERVFHPVAVHFKGSGFYTTDYGRRKAASSDSAPKGDSGESKESKASDSTEAKSSGSGKSDD
jgi:putative FmdB family regulatory protein